MANPHHPAHPKPTGASTQSALHELGGHDMHSPMGQAICAGVFGVEVSADLEDTMSKFSTMLAARGLTPGLIVGGRMEGGTVAGVVGVESPGRLGLLFLPPELKLTSRPDAWSEVLRAVPELARQRGLGMVQVLIEPGETARITALEGAGYSKLATLMYLERPSTSAMPRQKRSVPVPQFKSLREVGNDALGATLIKTYEGSLDCPALNGRRNLDEILAAHRAAGEFDPDLWIQAVVNMQPAGVMLLARIPGSTVVELVYMGVVPTFRGQCVGDAMLGWACRMCNERRFTSMTLAVDAANTYAIKLYERWRFKPIGRRLAYVVFIHD